MNQPPPGPPYGSPHGQGHYGSAPPPPWGAAQAPNPPHAGYPSAPPAAPRRSQGNLAVGLMVAFVVVVGGAGFAIIHHERNANYMVFHGDASLRARVDGKDEGALRRPIEMPVRNTPGSGGAKAQALVVDLKAGAHTIEIVDVRGNVVETTKLTAPEHGYRAVYTTGKQTAYTMVEADYSAKGGPPKLTGMHAAEPHVFIATTPDATEISETELALVDEKLPESILVKGSRSRIRRICSLDAEGEPTCL